MDPSPAPPPNHRERSPIRRRIITLAIGSGGLALTVVSAWLPWYHWSRSPFYAPPGCSLPAPPLELGGTVLFIVLALALLAVRLSIPGTLACAGSPAFVAIALSSGLLQSVPICGVSETVPAYGQLFALSGSILAIAANIADWRWNRRRHPVPT